MQGWYKPEKPGRSREPCKGAVMGMMDVKNLSPGLVLENSVVTPNGRLILPEGVVLTQEHIAYLNRWGISRVQVKKESPVSENPDPTTTLSPETQAKIENFLVPVFACNDLEEDLVQVVFEMGVRRLGQKCASGWKLPQKKVNLPVNDGSLRDIFYAGEFGFWDLIHQDVELASFPDIYFKIHKALNSPQSSADYLARIISQDPSLSAKLLRLVNSPFYGLRTQVDSISRAVAMVGANELTTLALGVSAINAFRDIPEELIDMRAFWSHSVATGILAKHLGSQLAGVSAERLFVAGLLHDIGRLVMFRRLPAISAETIIYAQSNLLPQVEAERDILGFDHGQVGAGLVRSWNLPKFLTLMIGGHHLDKHLSRPEVAVVHLADFLAICLVFSEKGSMIAPKLSHEACKAVQLDRGKLEEILPVAEKEFADVVGVFYP